MPPLAPAPPGSATMARPTAKGDRKRRVNTRALNVRADSIDAEARTVEAVIATERKAQVYDYVHWEVIDEILLVEGVVLPANRQIPLLDSHSSWSTKEVRGSVRSLSVEGGQLVGVLHFADDDDSEEAWRKYRDGHLTDVSVGYGYEEDGFTDIEPGQTETVNGKSYTAGSRVLRIATAWKPRETSAVAIGADEDAKTREEPHMLTMENNTRMENLAATLSELVDGMVSDEMPRETIVADMASAGGVSVAVVETLLEGAEGSAWGRDTLEGFATALETDSEELVAAAEADGYEYPDDSETSEADTADGERQDADEDTDDEEEEGDTSGGRAEDGGPIEDDEEDDGAAGEREHTDEEDEDKEDHE